MDIERHIETSFSRLSGGPYAADRIWQKSSYDWPADWEGRALLAFSCLFRVTGKMIPCADEIVSGLGEHLNAGGYMGGIYQKVDEQQLSGHSWLLRGLLEYWQITGSAEAKKYADGIVEGLFLPAEKHYHLYPADRIPEKQGNVSGSRSGEAPGWRLSTDRGCAFMCIDGLSEYYRLTGDRRVRNMLCTIIGKYLEIDFGGQKLQTHAVLSAARGILTLYSATGDEKLLADAETVFAQYIKNGMTLTYENFNWFGRPDSWTEPCAVVDSFILALRLHGISGRDEYLRLARRIWFNGLSFCHRANGGAGPNTCVTEENRVLKVSMYEAPFCCTMRYCEGLVYADRYRSLLTQEPAQITTDRHGRRFIGDRLLVKNAAGREMPLDTLCFPENDGTEYTV